jgi:hypothetical protein
MSRATSAKNTGMTLENEIEVSGMYDPTIDDTSSGTVLTPIRNTRTPREESENSSIYIMKYTKSNSY